MDSYDNDGGEIKGYIRAELDGTTLNAGYSPPEGSFPNCLFYGSGDGGTHATEFGSIDIVGHEYFHGVTTNIGQLEYELESAALCESFSDIFGYTLKNNQIGSTNWMIGDDIAEVNLFERSFNNPKLFGQHFEDDEFVVGQPDAYNGEYFYTGGNDNYFGHINCSVLNRWFYLLSAGESNVTNDHGLMTVSVYGIGISNAFRIAFNTATEELISHSSFYYARLGSIFATIDLFGFFSNEVKQVLNAWDAVGYYGQATQYCTRLSSLSNPTVYDEMIYSSMSTIHLYYTIESGNEIIYRADDGIYLQPNFEVELGAAVEFLPIN